MADMQISCGDDGRSVAGPFVLASESPRRRQLLSDAGYDFDVMSPPFDEPDSDSTGLTARQHAEAMAYFKARSVFDSFETDRPVLAADTVVAMAGKIFGKPEDESHARAMLRAQSGTSQDVITGVCLVSPCGARFIGSCVTNVYMRNMSDADLEAYIVSGKWRGKAGSYGIQDSGDEFIERIEGSFSNVVGLPMELVGRLLGSPPGRAGK